MGKNNLIIDKFIKIFKFPKYILRNFKNFIKFQEYQEYRKNLPCDPKQDDVYLVAFPKSGITWLSFILANIYMQLTNKKESITFFNYPMYILDIGTLTNKMFISNSMERRLIKSHGIYNPYYPIVIYLLRNPFDVIVSYYNFMRYMGYRDGFNEFVKSRQYGISSWSEHIKSWLYHETSAQRIYLIKYEDLQKDTFKEINNICINLGLNIDKNIIEKSIELSSLENMKDSEELYRQHNPNYTLPFMGKDRKIPKEKLLTDEIKNYILNETKKIIEKFYPSLIN